MRRVVLVRSAGPRNVGTALRAAANFGPAELVVVAPEHRSLLVHPEFEQMAHGVPDHERRCRVVPTLADALADCTWVVAFTGRLRDHMLVQDWREVRAETARRGADPSERVALLFGTEIHGLVQEDLERANVLVRLATSEEHGSLNLGVTAALALYDTFDPDAPHAGGDRTTALDGRAREYLKEHVKDTLAGRARSEQVRGEIAASVERLFSRAVIETRDARAWHAVMRALGNTRSPLDYGLGGDAGE